MSPKVVLSILKMRTRRRAAVSSFGSGRSWELTSIMKAEVTAENRPACDASQHGGLSDVGNIRILVSCLGPRRVSS